MKKMELTVLLEQVMFSSSDLSNSELGITWQVPSTTTVKMEELPFPIFIAHLEYTYLLPLDLLNLKDLGNSIIIFCLFTLVLSDLHAFLASYSAFE